jgi:hypothetical protein
MGRWRLLRAHFTKLFLASFFMYIIREGIGKECANEGVLLATRGHRSGNGLGRRYSAINSCFASSTPNVEHTGDIV